MRARGSWRRTALAATAVSVAAWAGALRVSATQSSPDDELPDGQGKKILQASCTSCHDLDEVTKFKGYYTRTQWKDVVQTMVDYGAKLQPGEVDVLTDYLAEHLGKK